MPCVTPEGALQIEGLGRTLGDFPRPVAPALETLGREPLSVWAAGMVRSLVLTSHKGTFCVPEVDDSGELHGGGVEEGRDEGV
jgi:hypothetical protein